MVQVINKYKAHFECMGKILRNLLQIVDLEDQYGNVIKYKNFSIQIRVKDTKYNVEPYITYIPYTAVRFTEPRIIMVKKHLENIMSLCTLFFDGQEIPVAGFRLKLKYWCTSPPTTLLQNIGSPTSLCNSQCKFCYIKGSPFWYPNMLSLSEAQTRVKYYSCKTKKGLFLTSYEYGEPFLNSNFLKILKLIREKSSDEVLYPIITNGSLLTESVIKSLAEVKPIILDISLNAVTDNIRKKFMGGQNHENATNSVKILKSYGIPFRGTIIAWPGLPYKEIEKTIKYLDTYEPQLIAIYPPGYTKYHQCSYTISDMNKHWQELAKFYLKIRCHIKSPLLFSPNSFWNRDLKAIIDGVIKNSPAEKAGIKIGDIIYAINGDRIFSRESARSKLQLLTQRSSEIEVTITRNGNLVTLRMINFKNKAEDLYPYKPKGYLPDPSMPFGIILIETFKPFYLRYLKEILKKYAPKKALCFVSILMKPQLEALLKYYKNEELWGNVKMKFMLMKNSFWGGNIMLGDLMTVDDFIYQIKTNREIKKDPPDLIIIPSSFLIRWGRDYAGKYYKEIERETGLKVALLPCTPILL